VRHAQHQEAVEPGRYGKIREEGGRPASGGGGHCGAGNRVVGSWGRGVLFQPRVVESIPVENSGWLFSSPHTPHLQAIAAAADAASAGAGAGADSWAGAGTADEARLGELTAWLTGPVKLTGAAAAFYAPLFLQANIGSVDRLRRRLGGMEMEEGTGGTGGMGGMGLLRRLGVDEFDAKDIRSALLETDGGRAPIPPSGLGGRSDGRSDFPNHTGIGSAWLFPKQSAAVSVSAPGLGKAQSALSPHEATSSDLDGIVQLIDDLTNGTAQGKAQAAGALALADDNMKTIVNAGAVPPLIALLLMGTAEGKANALRVFAKLTCDDASKRTIVAWGAVPPLVLLLTDGSVGSVGSVEGPSLKEQAVKVLANLATITAARKAIVEQVCITIIDTIIPHIHSNDAYIFPGGRYSSAGGATTGGYCGGEGGCSRGDAPAELHERYRQRSHYCKRL
jgi:hypothetical protein